MNDCKMILYIFSVNSLFISADCIVFRTCDFRFYEINRINEWISTIHNLFGRAEQRFLDLDKVDGLEPRNSLGSNRLLSELNDCAYMQSKWHNKSEREVQKCGPDTFLFKILTAPGCIWKCKQFPEHWSLFRRY